MNFLKRFAMKRAIEYLIKCKFIQGHRRQVGIGLQLAAGAIAALNQFAPALTAVVPGAVAAIPILATAGAYIGIVGAAYKDEYGDPAKQPTE